MDPSELVNYGALGVGFALFVTGLIVSKKEHDRVLEERDRAWRQRDDLIEDVNTKVAPALERAASSITSREHFEGLVLDVLTDVRRLLEGDRGP